MTSTAKESDFDVAAFFAKNQQALVRAGVGVVVIGAGVWFWIASANRKAERAEQAFVSAERSFYSGNAQLAKADLERVVERYANTPAGVRASMLLAKNRYQDSKPAEGVAALQAAAGRSAAGPFRAAVYALMAAGYENENKPDSAATAYASAAAATSMPAERDGYLAGQARALAAANKKADAIKVWQSIASRETSALVNEAKLRIGELSATPAKGS